MSYRATDVSNPPCRYCGVRVMDSRKSFRIDGTGAYHHECKEAAENVKS